MSIKLKWQNELLWFGVIRLSFCLNQTGWALRHTQIGKKQILSILLIFFWISSNACDCYEIKNLKRVQKEEYESYPLIFVGAVEQLNNDGTYSFKVVEVFKGQLTDSLIHGKSQGYCFRTPKKQQYMWLVYASLNEDGTITIDECSLSRSFFFPYLSNEQATVPPPAAFYTRSDKTVTMLDSELTALEYKKIALEVLRAEINQLRTWRDE